LREKIFIPRVYPDAEFYLYLLSRRIHSRIIADKKLGATWFFFCFSEVAVVVVTELYREQKCDTPFSRNSIKSCCLFADIFSSFFFGPGGTFKG